MSKVNNLLTVEKFSMLGEFEQAAYLVECSKTFLPNFKSFPEISVQCQEYFVLAEEIVTGQLEDVSDLMIFLNDPKEERDFNSFFEAMEGYKEALDALDFFSYACGFVCRVYAGRFGISKLSDPVLESTPYLYEDHFYDLLIRYHRA